MMCYRDKTFCDFHTECQYGKECDRALTDEVKAGAVAWMGENAPIARYTEKPSCFVELVDKR